MLDIVKVDIIFILCMKKKYFKYIREKGIYGKMIYLFFVGRFYFSCFVKCCILILKWWMY